MHLYLDIETVPLATSLAAEYPRETREPPANYKKEEAIAGWYEKDEQTWRAGLVKACSVNPRLGRVLCVGARDVDESRALVRLAHREDDERAALAFAFARLADVQHRVVTWNGTFDLRFLLVRALAHDFVPPRLSRDVPREWLRRFGSTNHTDVKAVLMNGDLLSSDGLDEWAAFFGLPSKPDGMNGAEVYPAYQRGEFERIATYCGHDVDTLASVHQRVATLFG